MSEKNNTAVQESIPPMGIRMIAREFKKDKIDKAYIIHPKNLKKIKLLFFH